jgi:2,4-dienoyl-CoA reductase-like NADH-dependent reductase (Old Yellow Enzyme family)
MGVGMLFDPVQVNRAIAQGQCDLAAFARGMLSDPHWAWRAAAALGGEVGYPPQYVRGYRSAWLREQRGRGGSG